MHLHGPAPLHIITSPCVTRKSFGTLPPLAVTTVTTWIWLLVAAAGLPIEVPSSAVSLRSLFVCLSLPSQLPLPIPSRVPNSRLKINVLRLGKTRTSRVNIYRASIVQTEQEVGSFFSGVTARSFLRSAPGPNRQLHGSPAPRLISVTSIPPGYLIRYCEVLVRYHLSLSIHTAVHSFLRLLDRITHHRDCRPRPTDHPDTPTTGPHPFPPLRQVPIHSSSATTPTTAFGSIRIASPGRLYRTTFASSLPPISP